MTNLAQGIASARAETLRMMRAARECIAAKDYAGAVPLLDQAMIHASAAREFAVADQLFNLYVDMKVLAFG